MAKSLYFVQFCLSHIFQAMQTHNFHLNAVLGRIDEMKRGGIPHRMHLMARGNPIAEAGGESQMLVKLVVLRHHTFGVGSRSAMFLAC